jgi:hypothetical protein
MHRTVSETGAIGVSPGIQKLVHVTPSQYRRYDL